MKKFRMIFLSLLVIVLATGCGLTGKKEQKLVCRTVEDEDGMNIEQVVSMTFRNDKLTHMTMEVNSKFTDPTILDNWDNFKEVMNKDNQEFSKDGVSLTVSINDENYEYNTKLDIDIENASEEILKEQGFEGLKDDTGTLEVNKKDAEEDGAICEIQ